MFCSIGAVRRTGGRLLRLAGRWREDRKGATAIEFGILALPFMMMLIGTIAVGLFYFTTFSFENAVERAARLIRIGEVQQSGMSAEEFKDEICSRLPGYIDCAGKMRVNVQNYSEFSDIVTPSCTDNDGKLVPPASTTYNAGSASEVVLVTVCYEWEFAGKLPFIKVGSMPNGSALIQASTTFRTEPYED